jgi:hypothetical protein
MWLVADCGGMSPDSGQEEEEKDRTSLQEGHLAALLIGHREDILQTGIPVPEFIAPSLFCLDALTTGRLLPSICDTLCDVHTHVLV